MNAWNRYSSPWPIDNTCRKLGPLLPLKCQPILGDAHAAPSRASVRCHDDSFCWCLERHQGLTVTWTMLTPVIIRLKETGEARTDTHRHHPLQVIHWQEWTSLNHTWIQQSQSEKHISPGRWLQHCKIMRHLIWKVFIKKTLPLSCSPDISHHLRVAESVELNFQWSQYLNRATPNIWSYLEF